MAWFIIIFSVMVVWVASLCKILYTSWSPSKAKFLNSDCRNQVAELETPGKLLAQHSFKRPLRHFVKLSNKVMQMEWGPLEKKSSIRLPVLKVPLQQVKILDHPDLQVITSDDYGVSGHCNHCDVNRGVQKLLHDISQRNVEAWELVSTSILRKYSEPADIWLSILYAMHCPNGQIHCLLNEHPHKSYAAMAQHMSQWVWFRKLFVLFSSYTYVNTLKKINM